MRVVHLRYCVDLCGESGPLIVWMCVVRVVHLQHCVDLCGESGPLTVLCGSVWGEWSTYGIVWMCVVRVVHSIFTIVSVCTVNVQCHIFNFRTVQEELTEGPLCICLILYSQCPLL